MYAHLSRLDIFCYPLSWGHSSCTSCHDAVDLSMCLEDTAMLYGILLFFWSIGGLLFLSDCNGYKAALPISVLHMTKLCGVAMMMQRDRKAGLRTSGLFLAFWILMSAYGSFKLRTYILVVLDNGVDDVFRLVTFCIQYMTYIIQLVLSVLPEPKAMKTCNQSERLPSPEENATFLSQITWWWQNKLIWQGWRRPLVYEDLADLCHRDKSAEIAARFQKNWDYELQQVGTEAELLSSHHHTKPFKLLSFGVQKGFRWQKLSGTSSSQDKVTLATRNRSLPWSRCCGRRRTPSLIWALAKTFWKMLVSAVLFKLGQDLLAFAGPQLLKLMIRFIQDESQPHWYGYLYAVLMFVAASLQSLFLQQYFYRCMVIGMNIRTSIIAIVYSKALRLSNRARQNSTVGEIVNLISVDAQRLMDAMTFINLTWSAPLQIVLSLIFLYLTMGPSIFAGFAVMVVMIPLNGLLASQARKLQVKQMKEKDSRMELVNEVLNGIKVIKMYAWETSFLNVISKIRNAELSILKKAAVLESFTTFTWTCAPFLVSLVTFATYSLANANNPDERLTADKAFVALSLFNVLRFPLTMLPVVVTNLIQASVSVKRLINFLRNEELDPYVIEWTTELDSDAALSLRGASFSWDSEKQCTPTLSNLNLTVNPKQLVAVVGPVGAGKSSLIQAFLGEMEKLEGHVQLKGSVAYVPQQAWIQNNTLQENILFGKDLHRCCYTRTIDGCALKPDLELLPRGDLTEIGGKGINLSGGQKQRVSLARAVYQDADIYLLDDPLSAVDSHVGKHIFEKIIGPEGMLKDKVRVLVTHGLGFLSQCDVIVVMSEGRITEVGSYSTMVDNNGAFAEFLRTYSNSDKDVNKVCEKEKGSSCCADKSEKPKSEMPKSGKQKMPSQKPDLGACAAGPCCTSQPSAQEFSEDEEGAEKKGLTTEEEVKTGRIHYSVLIAYLKACTWLMTIVTFFFFFFGYASSVGGNFWLATWSNVEAQTPGVNFTQTTECDDVNAASIGCYLGVYAVFGVFQALFVFLSSFGVAIGTLLASRSLHDNMLSNILRSPISFFDTTPVGRILNRFSKDVNIIDETIPRSIRSFVMTCFTVFTTLLVVAIASPIFIAVVVPMAVIYFMIQRLYVATTRQLKRLESITRSPIYSQFQETLLGVASIRAYRQQEKFRLESERRLDHNQIAYYPSVNANRWLAIRLEFIGNLIIFSAALFVAIQRNYGKELGLHISAGVVGLSLSYALTITECFNCVVRMISELETHIVAVERTKEYAETPREASPIIKDCRPAPDWPSEGRVVFDSYSTRYRKGLDLVLEEISVDIPGGAKVGIVGRTGAGKSSMTLALFRIIEPAGGRILVDGVNIVDYGLDDLRARITIIPQDPVLFSGTLRINLDPFESYKDGEIWKALECAHLSSFVSTLKEGLHHPIAEGGENLSVGQRQLVCLARALLRKTKILVLDETTAAVDLEMDYLIQKTIRNEFAKCTIITIAHRLNTIMDYDKIIVLDKGQIKEFATPTDLLADRSSRFFFMAKDAGLV